jgi:hypothetical protein
MHIPLKTSLKKSAAYVPDAILLNGGVFRSDTITKRVIDLVSSWANTPPVLLENQHTRTSSCIWCSQLCVLLVA